VDKQPVPVLTVARANIHNFSFRCITASIKSTLTNPLPGTVISQLAATGTWIGWLSCTTDFFTIYVGPSTDKIEGYYPFDFESIENPISILCLR